MPILHNNVHENSCTTVFKNVEQTNELQQIFFKKNSNRDISKIYQLSRKGVDNSECINVKS